MENTNVYNCRSPIIYVSINIVMPQTIINYIRDISITINRQRNNVYCKYCRTFNNWRDYSGNYMATSYYINHILNTDQTCFTSVDISMILIIKHTKSLSVCLMIRRTVPISSGLQQSVIMISVTHHLSTVKFHNWRGCNTTVG